MEQGGVTDDEELEGGSRERATLEGCCEEVAGGVPNGGSAPVICELYAASAGVVSRVHGGWGWWHTVDLDTSRTAPRW